ncbi:MAG: hypothetical protein R6V59_03395 [Dehalococcoidia bacterium]
MDAANPAGVPVVDPGLALMVLLLGIFFVIVGIMIAGVVYREVREWRKMILPMFDRASNPETPESPEKSVGLTARQAALGKQILGRIFTHMDVAGLLGGGATVVMGILIVLIGLALYS